MTTAEQFTDAMTARRIIRENAFDQEHAESLETLLSLTIADVMGRYCVGATRQPSDSGAIVTFVDGSVAVNNGKRWAA